MNFENFVLGLLDSSANFDFNAAIRSFLVSLAVIWLFVVVWVWMDSGERSRNIFFRILSVLIVLVLNILGLIIYLLMRPKDTVENLYWSDLERRFLLYETSELGDCENCGLQLRPGFNVCPSCSYPVNIECNTCKQMIDKHWDFCPYCSTKQEHQFVGFYPESSHGVSEEAMLAAGMVNSDISRAIRRKSKPETEKVTEPEITKEAASTVKEELVVKEKAEKVEEAKVEVEEEVEKEEEAKAVEIPTSEEMAESVEGTKEKMNEDLEEKGMKYQKSPGVAVRLGNYVMVSVYKFGEKINQTALKVSGRIETPNSTQDEKTDNKKKEEKVKEKPKKKSTKKSSSKKKSTKKTSEKETKSKSSKKSTKK